MMNGIFLLDKPIGVSSNHILQKIKRLLKAKKAGHTGTLDPMASGMLPICFGESTKFCNYLLNADKTYLVTMQLGVRTNTSDAEGSVIATRQVPHFSIEDIMVAFNAFCGDILQVPTMFSALKYQGKKLYEYAREGIVIERVARPITIYSINVLSLDHHDVTFVVNCSKGTYVRTLVDDVGEKLQCGAHVTQLRRLSVGPFLEDQMTTIEQVQLLLSSGVVSPEKFLLPVDAAVLHLPQLIFSLKDTLTLKQGKKLIAANDSVVGFVRFYDESQQFFGVGEVLADGVVVPRRLVASCY